MATLTIADLDNGKRDLQTVDAVANSRAATATTRYGQQTTTLYEAIRRIGEKGDEVLSNLGFRAPVPYASGLEITDSRFTVTGPDGKVYAPLSAPFTTGAWDPAQWYVLQNDLNDHKLLIFDSYLAASAAAAVLPDGQLIDAPAADGTPIRFEVSAGMLVEKEYLLGFRPKSSVNALALGVVQSKTIDCVPALQRIVDTLVSFGQPFVIILPAGDYFFGSELNLEAVNFPFAICAEESRSANIYYSPIGAAKKLFKGGALTAEPTICGFRFIPTSTGADLRKDPIPIYFPSASRPNFSRLSFENGGNTSIWTTRNYNSTWFANDVFFCGYSIPHKNIPLTTTYTNSDINSNVLLVNAATFSAADVGKDIILSGSVGDGGSQVFRITGYTSPQQVTLDRPIPWLIMTPRTLSFVSVTGSINSGSAIFNSAPGAEDVFTADDVGRFIYIYKAAANNAVLVSTIIEVLSPTQVRLADVAGATVTDTQWTFTPSVFLGSYASGDSINDQVITGMRIEGHKGWGLLTQGGLHVYLNNLKTHGRTWGEFENFGRSGPVLVNSSTSNMVVNGWNFEMGTATTDSAPILMCGSRPNMTVIGMTVNAPCVGGYIFDFDPSGTVSSGLHIATTIQINSNQAKFYKGSVKADTMAKRARVTQSGIIQAPYGMAFNLQAAPVGRHEPYFLADNAVIVIDKPPADSGQLAVTVRESVSRSGTVGYSHTASFNACEKFAGGSNFAASTAVLTGTTGEAGQVTVSSNGGKIYIENRGGSGRWFSWTFIG